MSEVFFTSDTHFFHKKILEFCPTTRKGADVHEMNENIVQAWNSRVGPDDNVYHLGDFSFGKEAETRNLLERLNGHIHLVNGNHDSSKLITNLPFVSVSSYKTLRIERGDQIINIVMMHFPIESWDRMHHGAIHLHGHLHGDDHHTCRRLPNRMDVGVDCRPQKDMAPFSLDEVLDLLKTQNAGLEILKQAGDL